MSGESRPLPSDHDERPDEIKNKIFATLPNVDRVKYKLGRLKRPAVLAYPNIDYSKVMRRISREVGDCLTGIAFGSGASLGLAHIGIIKVLEREAIPVDIVVGTSIGALIGALWASGRSGNEIEKIVSEFRDRAKTMKLADPVFPKLGLIRGNEVRRFLAAQFGSRTFYDLMMPLKIVACDIENRDEVVIDKGSIVDAIMASIAIPGIFEPVNIGGRYLLDGGIINPLPTNVLIRMGVSKIIAVNALPSPEDVRKSKKKIFNIFDIIVNSVQASEYLLAEASCKAADIAMHPIVSKVDWYEFYESEKVIKRGEEEALRYLPQLKELAAR
jgi:NTE family protein